MPAVPPPSATQVAFAPSNVVMHGASSPTVQVTEQTWNCCAVKLWQLFELHSCSSVQASYSVPSHVRLSGGVSPEHAAASTSNTVSNICMPRAYPSSG